MGVREEISNNINTTEKEGEGKQKFLERIVSEIYELPNSEAIFDGFSKEAKKWFDDAIDVINDNYDNPNNVKDIKDFPEEKEQSVETVKSVVEEKKSNEIEIGNFVRIETTDGKVVEGNVTEATKRRVTVGKEGVTKSKIKSWVIINGEDVEEETPFEVDEVEIDITEDDLNKPSFINEKVEKEVVCHKVFHEGTDEILAERNIPQIESEHSCKCSSAKKSNDEIINALGFFKQGIDCLVKHFS